MFEATMTDAGGSLGTWIVLNAVSDIGFQGTDPLNGSNDSACQEA